MFKEARVKDWMTRNVLTVAPETQISAAHEIMKKNGIRRLPVVKHGKLVGIITIGDVREASPSGATSLSIWELNYLWAQLTVEKVMTHKVITASPDMSIVEVAAKMLEYKISGLPVVEHEDRVVGIITESDIFKMLVKVEA